MDTEDNTPQQRVFPTLRITNYAASKKYYVEVLGFRIDWEHRFEPNLPVFMQVSRDGIRPRPDQIIEWAVQAGSVAAPDSVVDLPPWHSGIWFRRNVAEAAG